jgi:hypothetical protein
VTRFQAIAAGDLRLSGRAAAERAAFGQQIGTGGAVNGAVDTAAAEQRFIGGVDDGVDVELGDVAFKGAERNGYWIRKVRGRTVWPSPSTTTGAIAMKVEVSSVGAPR